MPGTIVRCLGSATPAKAECVRSGSNNVALVTSKGPFAVDKFALRVPGSVGGRIRDFDGSRFGRFICGTRVRLGIGLGGSKCVVVGNRRLPMRTLRHGVCGPVGRGGVRFFLVPRPFPRIPSVGVTSSGCAHVLGVGQCPCTDLARGRFRDRSKGSLGLGLAVSSGGRDDRVRLACGLGYTGSIRRVMRDIRVFGTFVSKGKCLVNRGVPSSTFPSGSGSGFSGQALSF